MPSQYPYSNNIFFYFSIEFCLQPADSCTEACRGACRETRFSPCYFQWSCTWRYEKIVGIQWTPAKIISLVIGLSGLLSVVIFVGYRIFLCVKGAQRRRREVAEALPVVAYRNLLERERAEEAIGQ